MALAVRATVPAMADGVAGRAGVTPPRDPAAQVVWLWSGAPGQTLAAQAAWRRWLRLFSSGEDPDDEKRMSKAAEARVRYGRDKQGEGCRPLAPCEAGLKHSARKRCGSAPSGPEPLLIHFSDRSRCCGCPQRFRAPFTGVCRKRPTPLIRAGFIRGFLRASYFGASRTAPSSRSAKPFIMSLSMME